MHSLLFVEPFGFIIGSLLVLILVLVVAKLVIGLTWRLVLLAGFLYVVLWLIGSIGAGPPGQPPIATQVIDQSLPTGF